jgi:hypothetical protein
MFPKPSAGRIFFFRASLFSTEITPIWSQLAGKMKKCYCLEGDLANNPLMDLLDLVLSCELLVP